ncbi:MAG: hypothetical protein KGI33_09425 [Thaumarchaeota archaeon]|nr:hypothetical protein [Nitrososphaerota archaeon]
MAKPVVAISLAILASICVIPAFAGSGTVAVVSGKTFQVNYTSNGVTVQDIETNPTYDELVLTVQVSGPNAFLQLTIPRALLDSKQGNQDIPFIGVVDGTLANIQETNPAQLSRTISFSLEPGNKQIEIIGTYVAMPGSSAAVPGGGSAPSTLQQPEGGSHTTSTPSPTLQNQTAPAPKTASTAPAPSKHIMEASAPPAPVASQNITTIGALKIPYLQNTGINLSAVDLSVVGAISVIVIIVVASTARKKAAKIGK